MKKFNKKWIVAPLALCATVGAVSGALQAQPDVNNAPKGENPAGQQRGGREGRGGERPNFQNMTPEQRQQFQQQMQQRMQQAREAGIRRSLTRAGYEDQNLQDAVIAFVSSQEEARRSSQDKVRQLAQAVRDGGAEAQVAGLLAEVRAEQEAAEAQRAAALQALDAKINFSGNPKLDATLMLMGVTGEAGAGFGGRGMGGRMGDRGGFGGGNRAGRAGGERGGGARNQRGERGQRDQNA